MPAKKRAPESPAQHPGSLSLEDFAGHRIRRLQQIAVAAFVQDVDSPGLTPVQFAVLYSLLHQPGIDQRRLAKAVRFDTSTIGSVVDRLEARGLLLRGHSDADRRVRLLNLTPEGAELVGQVYPAMVKAQERILDPLSNADRREFMRLMAVVIAHHESGGQGPDTGFGP